MSRFQRLAFGSCRVAWFARLALLAAIAALAPAPRGAAWARDYALLVACTYDGSQQFTKLQYTQRDIEEFAHVLVESGYDPADIVLLHEKQVFRAQPALAHIEDELNKLIGAITPEDSLIVAFSGHGLQFTDDAEHYFCPVDGKWSRPETLLALRTLHERLRACKAGKKLLLVDACRNDPAHAGSKNIVRLFTAPKDLEARTFECQGLVSMFSCSAAQVSWEHAEIQHGVFFHHVIEGWRQAAEQNGDGELTVDELVAYVRDETQRYVRRHIAKLQAPSVRSDLEGRWVLRKLERAPKPADLAPKLEPLAVVSAAPLQEWQGGLKHLAALGKYPDLVEQLFAKLPPEAIEVLKHETGLDWTRRWGAYVETPVIEGLLAARLAPDAPLDEAARAEAIAEADKTPPTLVVLLPVASEEKLLAFLSAAGYSGQETLAAGQRRLTSDNAQMPTLKMVVRENYAHLYWDEVKNPTLPENPELLLGGRQTLEVSLFLDRLPVELKQVFLDAMVEGALEERRMADGEDSLIKYWADNNVSRVLHDAAAWLNQAQSISAGFQLDPAEGVAAINVSLEYKPGVKLRREATPSLGLSRWLPADAPFNVALSVPLDPALRDAYHQLFTAFFDGVAQEEGVNLPLVHAIDVEIRRWLALGRLEIVAALRLKDGQPEVLAALQLPPNHRVPRLLQTVGETLGDPDLLAALTEPAEVAGMRVHHLPTGADGPRAQLGLRADSLWLSIGAAGTLETIAPKVAKAREDASGETPREPLTQCWVNCASLRDARAFGRFPAETERENAAFEALTTAGVDQVSLVVEPLTNGVRTSLSTQRGGLEFVSLLAPEWLDLPPRALPAPPSAVERLLAEGRAAQLAGRYYQAEEHYTEALRLAQTGGDEPGQVGAYLGRSRALMETGRYELALKDASAGLALDRNHAKLLARRALALAHLQRGAAAKIDGERALQLDPREANAHLARGLAHLHATDHHKAESDFKRALEVDFEDPVDEGTALFLLAAARGPTLPLNARQGFEQAKRIYDLRLAMDGDHPGAINDGGNCALQLGDLDAAQAAYERAIQIEPRNPVPYVNLAVLRLARGDAAEALRQLAKAEARAPSFPGLGARRVEILLAKGDNHQAKQLADTLVKAAPQRAEAHFVLGLALARLKSHKKAVESFTAAIRQAPNAGHFYAERAQAHLELGDKTSALHDLRTASDKDKRLAEALAPTIKELQGDE